MKILLIYPTKLDEMGKPIKYKKAFLPPLSLAILNSLTPPQHKLRIVNEIVEQIDYTDSYDLVAITAMTAQIPRAYQIADCFRKLNIRVIIGGIHATVLPEEVKQHADSVVIGEVEDIWEQILSDFENNSYKEFYKDNFLPDLQTLVVPKWDNINLNIYAKPFANKYPMMPFHITRGCIFNCKFCSVSKYYGRTYRIKPIGNVLKELDSLKMQNIFFVDDNIACDAEFSKELFKSLIKKKLRWFSQISTTVLKNPELIELAGKSGCYSLLIGIESLGRSNLKSINKGFNRPEAYEELFLLFQAAGIMPIATIIFGFDEDTFEIFKLTLDFLVKNRIKALFQILTPLPGTSLYDEMMAQDRIINNDWSKYNTYDIVFKPKLYSADELHHYFWKIYRDFFSFQNMISLFTKGVSISSHPIKESLESLFYLSYARKKVYASEHPLADGIFKIKP